jgi:hypothetical protein
MDGMVKFSSAINCTLEKNGATVIKKPRKGREVAQLFLSPDNPYTQISGY